MDYGEKFEVSTSRYHTGLSAEFQESKPSMLEGMNQTYRLPGDQEPDWTASQEHIAVAYPVVDPVVGSVLDEIGLADSAVADGVPACPIRRKGHP
jgi:hypothetical protein